MESLRQTRERNLLEIAKIYNIDGDDAMLLQRISHRLHQLDELACNWGVTEHQAKRTERLEGQAREIASKYSMIAYHQSDPRGWSLYLVSPQQLAGYSIDAVYNRGLAICPH